MINLGTRGHDVTWGDTPERLAEGLSGYGVHVTQLALGKSFPDLPSGAADINPGMGMRIRRVLAKHGVDIAVLGCYINMTHPDMAAREAGLRKFEAYLANARFFGAPMVASETGSVDAVPGGFTEANFTESMYQEALASIRRLVTAGERFGTMVAVEPGANHPIYDIATTERLLADVDSPWLGVVFDATAYTTPDGRTVDGSTQLELAHEAFDRFGERIMAVHISDFTVEPSDATACGTNIRRCDAGTGELDIEGIVRLANGRRPWIPVILEHTTNEAIARAARQYGNL
ncbi:sugar phosphate isomerase/epimerase family protein [Bifidobacterium eulemuris]|uniref:AP endonuclease n=1 Tax=Bifidobacterium eulemuris TaxID=1765219 RepID=A0A261G928_9BIFI|nr:sugar phosphate isomerase/epimerase [Bifidobacterium eulemuris]OZG67506.1 AP endonuclease [Bifidobacterium eulemuris]QOL31047.1 sugar phosphate isomerase/epimerase [Bifidobacterium eulemuris]